MDITNVENEIYEIYQWGHRESPGVYLQEVGHLANLWAIADRYYAGEA